MRVVAGSDEVACTVTPSVRFDANGSGRMNVTGPGGGAGGVPASSPPPHAAIKPSRVTTCSALRQRESKRLFILAFVYPWDEQTIPRLERTARCGGYGDLNRTMPERVNTSNAPSLATSMPTGWSGRLPKP